LAHDRGTHFLSFIDQEDRTAPAGGQVIDPALTQRLEAVPALSGPQRDVEEIPKLPVEVRYIALRMIDAGNGPVLDVGKTLLKQAHDDALAGSRIAMDQREAAFADECTFSAALPMTPALAFPNKVL